MRRFILSMGLSAAMLFSASAGFVQPAVAQHAEKASATPAKPTARQLELARRYFAAMQFEETMIKMLEVMDPFEMLDEDEQAELEGIDREALTEATKEALVALSPQIIEGMIPIVASTFTEEELEAIVIFYESPAGQASVVKAADMMGPMTGVMMGLMPEYLEDLLGRYCAKATCSAGMKDKIRQLDS